MGMQSKEFINQQMRFKGYCKQCNKPIYAYYKSQLPTFCSRKCSNKWKWDNIREKRKYLTLTCACCGKSFNIDKNDHRIKNGQKKFFCSHKCANKTIRKKDNKICPICGKVFDKAKTKTCSMECGRKLYSLNLYKRKNNLPNLTYIEYIEILKENDKKKKEEREKSIKIITSNGCIRYYNKPFICVGREREYMKDYQKKNKERRALNHQKRLKEDEMYFFKTKVRKFIYQSFKRKKESKIMNTQEVIGCTFEEFLQYIISKFKDGMTIDNYGEWQIDHIIPLSLAKTKEDVIKLCHFTNLQPLWASENRKKSNIYKPNDVI